MDIAGKYNTAKMFADDNGERAISQILVMCNLGCYKDSLSIIENISPTIEILKIIKPIYNYKAS